MRKTRTIVLILGLMLLGITSSLFAEASEKKTRRNATAVMRYAKIDGTVQSINLAGNQMVVKDAGNNFLTVPLNAQTKIDKQDESALTSQIQVGDRVTVRYDVLTKSAVRIDILQPLKTDVTDARE